MLPRLKSPKINNAQAIPLSRTHRNVEHDYAIFSHKTTHLVYNAVPKYLAVLLREILARNYLFCCKRG